MIISKAGANNQSLGKVKFKKIKRFLYKYLINDFRYKFYDLSKLKARDRKPKSGIKVIDFGIVAKKMG